MVVSVYAAGGVILSVPVVGVAGCDVECSIFMIAYCQMQGVCAWAVVGICVVVCVCTCLGVCVVVPSKVFAGNLVVGSVCAVVDCKIEGVNVGAGRAWLGMVVGIDAAFCVVLAIPVVGVAGCDMIGSIVMVANC